MTDIRKVKPIQPLPDPVDEFAQALEGERGLTLDILRRTVRALNENAIIIHRPRMFMVREP